MTNEEARAADLAIAKSLRGKLCSDCPPENYPNDKTRCTSCPRKGHSGVFCGECGTEAVGLDLVCPRCGWSFRL